MSDKTSKKLRTLICGDKMLAAAATTTMQNTHIQQQKKRAGSISMVGLNGEVAVKAATIGKEVAATSQPQKLQQQQSQYKRKRAESKK